MLEIANRPVLPDADAPIAEAGIEVVPDILANGGGVVVSHAEWAQNRIGIAWDEKRVTDHLKGHVEGAAQRVLDIMEEHDCSMRDAAYGAALLPLCDAIGHLGTAKDFAG